PDFEIYRTEVRRDFEGHAARDRVVLHVHGAPAVTRIYAVWARGDPARDRVHGAPAVPSDILSMGARVPSDILPMGTRHAGARGTRHAGTLRYPPVASCYGAAAA